MTRAEATAAEKAAHAEYEARTVAFLSEGREVTIAEARKVFEKYHKESHWKLPVNTVVPYEDLVLFMNAVRFYHGCEPHCVVAKKGSVTDPGYRVTGPGYVC